MKIIPDVKTGKLHSAYVAGAFDNAKKALEARGYRVISLEEQAGLRIQKGADSSISIRGNWVSEAFVYDSDIGIFLSKKSPIMANAEDATNCHRNNNDFYLNDEQVEESLADSVKVINTRIPTKRFGDETITNFAFGKNAKAYGEFLRENGINSIQLNLTDSQDKPFARQVWLGGIGSGGSDLDGDIGFVGYADDEVRGVRASANTKGASVAQKIEAYTPEDIQRALKSLKLAGLESQILEALKK